MRQETLDSYQKAVNQVIDYINLNLHNSLDVSTLAAVAGISAYHFHRIFKNIIGENIGEYIIRLRLEDIAMRIRMNPQSIEEIAVKSGYQNKSAVSKAFKKHFGVNPSSFRKIAADTSQLIDVKLRKEEGLQPDVRTLEDKEIVYIRIIDWYGSPESYRSSWKQLGEFGVKNKLLDERTEWIGLSFDNPTITKPERCRFYACFTTKEKVKPIGPFGVQTIEGGLYAIFTLKGSYSGLSSLYYSIYMKWLPESDYILRKGISFELYVNHPDQVPEDEILTEVYIPIDRKRRWVLRNL